MKTDTELMVSVPTPTLNALKQMLFSSEEGGTDLSGIVEDLGGNALAAINVALAYKGVKPEIDTACRYDSYGKSITRFDFQRYSLILNRVFVTAVRMQWNADGVAEEQSTYETYFTLEEWTFKSTEPQPPEDK